MINLASVMILASSSNGIKQRLIDTNKAMYGSFFNEETQRWLDVSDDGPYKMVWDAIGPDGLNIVGVLTTMGIMLCLIYFFLNCIDKSMRQELTIETFFKECVLMVFSVVLIANSIELTKNIADIGTEIFESVNDAVYGTDYEVKTGKKDGPTNSAIEDYVKEENERIEKASGLALMNEYIMRIDDIIIIKIESILLVVACLSRGVLYILYSMMAPIGISDTYRNGANSKGIQYIKKLFAISLQAFVIYLIMMSVNMIRASVNSTLGPAEASWYVTALMLVALMLIFRSQQYVNDMVGV